MVLTKVACSVVQKTKCALRDSLKQIEFIVISGVVYIGHGNL